MILSENIDPKAFDASIFRSYDIRGVASEQLSSELAFAVGYSFAGIVADGGERRVLVGHDGRNSSPRIHQALVEGILAAGLQAGDLGLCTTPMLGFGCCQKAFGASSGIMVTASHNAGHYNGFKFVKDAGIFSELDTLYQLILQQFPRLTTLGGEYEFLDIKKEYFECIRSDIQFSSPIKVVIDGSNSIGGPLATELLQSMGAQVYALNIQVDGDFPGHAPDTSDSNNIQQLCRAVVSQKADLGFIFDGDGDRCVAVSSEGSIVWPDQLMMLMSEDLLRSNPGAHILYDIKCSNQLQKIIEQQGGKAEMMRTGRAHIFQRMKQSEALFAGEYSGHFFYKDRWFCTDDSLYAACRIIEGCQQLGMSLQQRLQQLPEIYSTEELLIAMDDRVKFSFIEQLRENIELGKGRLCSIDGLRLDYADGWGLVRASNTSPAITLRFEADSPTRLQQIQTGLFNQIEKTATAMGIAIERPNSLDD